MHYVCSAFSSLASRFSAGAFSPPLLHGLAQNNFIISFLRRRIASRRRQLVTAQHRSTVYARKRNATQRTYLFHRQCWWNWIGTHKTMTATCSRIQMRPPIRFPVWKYTLYCALCAQRQRGRFLLRVLLHRERIIIWLLCFFFSYEGIVRIIAIRPVLCGFLRERYPIREGRWGRTESEFSSEVVLVCRL